jgi:phage host-nuclease inhibitor protein Gam
MTIEYSNEVKGKVHAYRFSKWEMEAIANGLKSEVKKRKKKVDMILNSPKNEGQATYSIKVAAIRSEIEILNETIKEFSSGS